MVAPKHLKKLQRLDSSYAINHIQAFCLRNANLRQDAIAILLINLDANENRKRQH